MDSALIIKKKSNDGYYILFTMKIRKTIDHSQLVGKLRGEPTNDCHSHTLGICMALEVSPCVI